MYTRSLSLGLGGGVAAGALLVCGCGSPEGAGTVDMAAVKEAAAKRGIPEAKDASALKAKPNQAGERSRTLPTSARPKSGR
jgi:hypothetical protein